MFDSIQKTLIAKWYQFLLVLGAGAFLLFPERQVSLRVSVTSLAR